MKTYVVYFFIKANRTEYLADVAVEAPTAKAACALCKDWYFKTTGKNAFRPTTKLSDEDRKWYEDHNRIKHFDATLKQNGDCLLYTSPSPRDRNLSRMPSSA